MWFGMMWWVIPLVFFLAMRSHRRRWRRRAGWNAGRWDASGELAELRRVTEHQHGYIEELEARLVRVEDGLEFAERLLSERGSSLSPAP